MNAGSGSSRICRPWTCSYPTYNEGAEILEQTILAALALDYPVGTGPGVDSGRRPAALAGRPVPAARRRLSRPADE